MTKRAALPQSTESGSQPPNNMHHDAQWPRAAHTLAAGKGGAALLGVPLNRSISPGRCDLAPAAIREALLMFSDGVVGGGSAFDLEAYDAGDLDRNTEDWSEAIAEATKGARGTILLGGDNGVTRYGVLATKFDLTRLGLVTLDAHHDFRTLADAEHNGNPIRSLLQAGLPGENVLQLGIQSFANSEHYATEVSEVGINVVGIDQLLMSSPAEVLKRSLDHVDAIYLDIDLDVVDRAMAPGCPGARPGGLTPAQLRAWVSVLALDRRVRWVDIVELDPQRDVNQQTALLGASCVLETLASWARR